MNETTHRCPQCTAPLSLETCGVFFTFTEIKGVKQTEDEDSTKGNKFRLLKEGREEFSRKIDEHMAKFNFDENAKKGLFYSTEKDLSEDKDLTWNKVTIDRNAENFSGQIHCDAGLSFNEAAYPACHHCGYPIPNDFFSYKEVFVIGLTGAANSGKSVYLQSITLQDCAQLSEFASWEYEFSYEGLETLGVQKHYIDASRTLDRFGILPEKTPPGIYPPLLISMKHTPLEGGESTRYLISITDIAGESFMLDTKTDGEFAAQRHFLRNSAGCIFAVSVDEILKDKNKNTGKDSKIYEIPLDEYSNVVVDNRFVNIISVLNYELNRGAKIRGVNESKIPIAFVITKADTLAERDVDDYKKIYPDSEDSYFKGVSDVEGKGDPIRQFLPKRRQHAFAKKPVAYFAVSATGGNPESAKYGEIDETCDEQKKNDPCWYLREGINPRFVYEPFLWLIEKLVAQGE